jgi:hypothetical protein
VDVGDVVKVAVRRLPQLGVSLPTARGFSSRCSTRSSAEVYDTSEVSTRSGQRHRVVVRSSTQTRWGLVGEDSTMLPQSPAKSG